MKKSIPFLLASLAATSSLLFHTQEAKAEYKKNCETTMPIYLELYGDDREGTFRIRAMPIPSIVNKLQRSGLTFRSKKEAIKMFKKLCKGL